VKRSRTIEAALGYGEHDLEQTTSAWAELVHPEDQARMDASLKNHLEGQSAFALELRFRAKDGSHRWMLTRGTVIARDENGKPTVMSGMYSDITARKELELKLEKQHQFLQSVVDNLPFGLLVADKNRKVVLLNTTLHSTLNIPEAFFCTPNLHFDDIARFNNERGDYPGESYEAGLKRFVDVQEGGRSVRFERCQADGTWHEIQGAPLADGGYVLTYSNIDERKRQEQQLQLFANVIDNANDLVVICDAEPIGLPGPRIVFVNDAFVRETGYSREEAIGNTPRMLQGPKSDRATLDRIRAALEKWKPVREDVLNYTKDGREFWADLQISPIANEAGWYTHWIAIQRNITERKQMMLDLVVSKDAAQVANVAKSEFLARMSHELRTPMNGVLGMSQMLTLPGLTEQDRMEYAQVALTSGKDMVALLDEILDFSKMEAGQVQLKLAPLDVAQLLGHASALHGDNARQKGLAISFDWSGPSVLYMADRRHLSQMLRNLVGNAIKFTAQGNIRVEAREVKRLGQDATLEFSVTDTGIGIPADKQHLLFQIFSQVDGSISRRFGGTGLGLSIVQKLAQMMDGEVGVESKLGQGACFWFRIRAAVLATDTGTAAAFAESQASNQVQGPITLAQNRMASRGGRVLIVDDVKMNRVVAAAMLNPYGLELVQAENGQQALELVRQTAATSKPFDLVLMDVRMPVMDGHEATRQIRLWEAQTGQARLAIVAMTADAYAEDRQRCLDAGMDDFIAKPVQVEVLMQMLSRWLTKSKPVRSVALAASDSAVQLLKDFDEASVLSQCGGDRGLAKQIVMMVLPDMQQFFMALERAVSSGGSVGTRNQTHVLKGLAAQLGGSKLAESLRLADDHLKMGGMVDQATLVSLHGEYQALSEALHQWLGSEV
jgi:PAS domain S-box-containing protein